MIQLPYKSYDDDIVLANLLFVKQGSLPMEEHRAERLLDQVRGAQAHDRAVGRLKDRRGRHVLIRQDLDRHGPGRGLTLVVERDRFDDERTRLVVLEAVGRLERRDGQGRHVLSSDPELHPGDLAVIGGNRKIVREYTGQGL